MRLVLFGLGLSLACDSNQPTDPGSDPGPDPGDTKPASPGAWERTGGPLGGLGYDIRTRPDNPDIMFVTDAWAGVYKSTDGGRNWSPSNSGITLRTGVTNDAIPIFCLTIDPHDNDIIWAGAQYTRGIFKSVNGGDSWTKMDEGVVESDGISFRGFTVDPRDSDIVYAAAEISSWADSGEPKAGREFDLVRGVLYRTTNGGESWTAIWRGDNLARYIWVNPDDPDILYLSTGIFDREAWDSGTQGNNGGTGGVFKSTDGGANWVATTNGLGNAYVGSLYMHPEDPDILLAGAGNIQYPGGGGVYLTTDGAASWEPVLQTEIIQSVEFSEADPAVAYAGSSDGVYRSGDGGLTWERVTVERQDGWGPPGVRAGFPIDFQVDPRDSGRIFANNYGGGNFLSEDGGRSWVNASRGYTGAQVRDVAIAGDDPTRVIASARSGIFRSYDGGYQWTGLNTGTACSLEWNVVAVDPNDPQHLLASNNWNLAILESRSAGNSWDIVSPVALPSRGYRAIAFAPSDPSFVYAGQSAFYSGGVFDNQLPSGGVFRSLNGGSSWEAANDASSQDANIISLAVHPFDPRVVYAGTGNRGVLKTTDGGGSWTALPLGAASASPVLSVTVQPIQPEIVFVGVANGGLHRSTDDGESWQKVGTGLPPEANISDLVFNPVYPDELFLADQWGGVYRSTDGGSSWVAIMQGLRQREVNALAISGDGNLLYAATEGEGVYRMGRG